jgi:hypothetical protein
MSDKKVVPKCAKQYIHKIGTQILAEHVGK